MVPTYKGKVNESKYYIFILHNIYLFLGIIQSIDIVINSKRVAYTEEADDGVIYITNLQAPVMKRVVIFLLVSFIEVVLVLCLSYTGVGFM